MNGPILLALALQIAAVLLAAERAVAVGLTLGAAALFGIGVALRWATSGPATTSAPAQVFFFALLGASAYLGVWWLMEQRLPQPTGTRAGRGCEDVSPDALRGDPDFAAVQRKDDRRKARRAWEALVRRYHPSSCGVCAAECERSFAEISAFAQ